MKLYFPVSEKVVINFNKLLGVMFKDDEVIYVMEGGQKFVVNVAPEKMEEYRKKLEAQLECN
jgi:hypothetical protein